MSVKDGEGRDSAAANRVEQIVDYVLRGIEVGLFSPGQRLSEAEISDALNLKRGPVREALRILAGERVIDLQLNKGARVRRLDRLEMADMTAVLKALNEAALRIAFEKHTSEEIMAALDPLLDDLRRALDRDDHPTFMLCLSAYHWKLYELGDNAYMAYLWSRLHIGHFNRSFVLEFSIDDWKGVQDLFERAHEAMRRGDWLAAAKFASERADEVARILKSLPGATGNRWRANKG